MTILNRKTRDDTSDLLRDESGSVVTSELLLLGTVALLGLIVGAAALRDSLVSEFSDVQGSIQNTVQSYGINGTVSSSGTTSGMDFADATDNADDTEDIAGQAAGGTTFDVVPVDESVPVSRDQLVVEFLFDGGVENSSSDGDSNRIILGGGASVVDGELVFDGINDSAVIPNSTDINVGGPFPQRTIHIEFTPNDVNSRQLIFEEGGTIRGLNIYIDDGQLYFGGYNIPETGYQPTFLSTPIVAGQPISATLVLDGGPTVTADAFSAYANGSLVGRTPASQLFSHGGGIGIGAVNGRTVFHDGTSRGRNNFNGAIDSLSLFNRALDDSEVGGL